MHQLRLQLLFMRHLAPDVRSNERARSLSSERALSCLFLSPDGSLLLLRTRGHALGPL